MSGETTTKVITSSFTTAAGVAVLPNTGGNTLMTILGITLTTVGAIVLLSFAATRIAARFVR
jgi:hypothetical protein